MKLMNCAFMAVYMFADTGEELSAERALVFTAFQNFKCNCLFILHEDELLSFLFLTYYLSS